MTKEKRPTKVHNDVGKGLDIYRTLDRVETGKRETMETRSTNAVTKLQNKSEPLHTNLTLE
jgi:hypothetical protein